MIKYKYNNVILPVMPDEPDYPHAIIVDTGLKDDLDVNNPVYAIIFSKMEFMIIDSTIAYFVTDNEWKCYFALTSGTKWALSAITPSDPTAQIAGLCNVSSYVWCGSNISQLPEGNVYYTGTAPVEITAADEPVAFSSFNSEYTYTIGSSPSPLAIIASNPQPDGGTVSFEWHKRVNGKDGGVVSTEQNFYPPTDELGVTEYYCLVSNTLNDTITTEYTIGVVVTIIEVKSGRGQLIGCVLRQCGVPMAELIAEMLCKDKKVAASHYIYGVPSETGNIGLRSGESVTYYDGIVAKPLPERDIGTYPCAFVTKNENGWLIVSSLAPLYALRDGENYITAPTTSVSAQRYAIEDGVWADKGFYALMYKGYTPITPIWSNSDILDETSGEVFLAASDPIPVGEIVDTINGIPIYEDLR